MRYFLLIFLLINCLAIHNVFARKYDNDDDDQPIGRRQNERLKQSEDGNVQRRQKFDIPSKNNKISSKHDKTDVNAEKIQRAKKRFDNEKESDRKVFNVRDEPRTESKRANIRSEAKKYNKQEEKRIPKITDTRKNIQVSQVRKPPLKQDGKKSAKYIPDDTDEDDDDDDDDITDEDDDDDDDDDDTEEDDEVSDEDDDDNDGDDDDDSDEDDDDDNTDEDDTDQDDTDDDDDSFEMITYKDKKKPTFLQRLKGKKDEKPKKQLSYRKKVYRELGLVDDDAKHVSSEEIIVRPKKYSKRIRDCDSMEEDCP